MTRVKKRLSRFLALLLVMFAMLALSAPAFAESELAHSSATTVQLVQGDPEKAPATIQLEGTQTDTSTGGLDGSVVFMIVLYIVGLVLVIYIFLIRARRGKK